MLTRDELLTSYPKLEAGTLIWFTPEIKCVVPPVHRTHEVDLQALGELYDVHGAPALDWSFLARAREFLVWFAPQIRPGSEEYDAAVVHLVKGFVRLAEDILTGDV